MAKYTTERRRCEGTPWGKWARNNIACVKVGKVERDGKWYCGYCDPVAQAAKDRARITAIDARIAAANREQALATADATRRDALAELAGEHAGWVETALTNDETNVLIEASREYLARYVAIQAAYEAVVAKEDNGDGCQ